MGVNYQAVRTHNTGGLIKWVNTQHSRGPVDGNSGLGDLPSVLFLTHSFRLIPGHTDFHTELGLVTP